MASSRTKKQRRKPFVITVVHIAAAAAVPGCFSAEISNPPPSDVAQCPSVIPTIGDPCIGPIDCSFGPDECGQELSASCPNGTWEVQFPICNPPIPTECPTELPIGGQSCGGTASCSYDVDNGCGPQTFTADCDPSTFTWLINGPTCNPPIPDCAALTVETDCAVRTDCRWLVPGCGTMPLAAAGCFTATDCTADTDCTIAGQTCQEASIDPCYGMACNACDQTVALCLPTTTP